MKAINFEAMVARNREIITAGPTRTRSCYVWCPETMDFRYDEDVVTIGCPVNKLFGVN